MHYRRTLSLQFEKIWKNSKYITNTYISYYDLDNKNSVKYICSCKLYEFVSLSTSEISLHVFSDFVVFSNALPVDNGLIGWFLLIKFNL